MSSNVKGKGNAPPTNSKDMKLNYQMMEQERNMLKITLQYIAKENEDLKQQLEDMRMTVKHNKELLKEYVEKITNKDKVVEKMNATIEQLTTRMHSLEEYIKQSQIKVAKNSKEKQQQLQNTDKPKIPNSNVISNSCSLGSKKSSINIPPIILSSSENNTNNTNITIPPSNNSKENTTISNLTANTSNTNNTRNTSDIQKNIKNADSVSESDNNSVIKSDEKIKELNEKLELSYRSLNSSMMSINDNASVNLNNSVISHRSSTTVKKKFNLKDKFVFDSNMSKFHDFLNCFNPSKNILLFVDSKNNFWELVKRNDLTLNIVMNNCENIMSVTSGLKTNKFVCGDAEDSPKSKLLNIEIKDNFDDRSSLNNSELDISKVTDFNLSHFIRDMNEN